MLVVGEANGVGTELQDQREIFLVVGRAERLSEIQPVLVAIDTA
jgi:hypothetical protein